MKVHEGCGGQDRHRAGLRRRSFPADDGWSWPVLGMWLHDRRFCHADPPCRYLSAELLSLDLLLGLLKLDDGLGSEQVCWHSRRVGYLGWVYLGWVHCGELRRRRQRLCAGSKQKLTVWKVPEARRLRCWRQGRRAICRKVRWVNLDRQAVLNSTRGQARGGRKCPKILTWCPRVMGPGGLRGVQGLRRG